MAFSLSFIFIFSWIFTLSGCKKTNEKTLSLFACDTYITLTCTGKDANKAVKEASDLLLKMEAKFSRQKEDSEIAKLNQSSEKEPVTLSEDTYYILQLAKNYAEETGGRFDPTIAPIMDLWGFGTDNMHVPDEREIETVIANVDYRKVHLLSNRRAYVEPGVAVDLGGVAKGFIGDILMQKLRNFNLKKILLDLGGNICAWTSSSELTVGVASPIKPGALCCTYSVPGNTVCTVITSGSYERYFVEDGVRYGHIMDTRTGYPSSSDILSVTIIGQDGTRGDVYSTALFTVGPTDARTIASRQNLDCILCMDNGTLWVSSSLKGKVNAQDGWTISYFD